VVQNEEEEEAPCLHLAVLEPADSKMPQVELASNRSFFVAPPILSCWKSQPLLQPPITNTIAAEEE
jgi:hypothetical protein